MDKIKKNAFFIFIGLVFILALLVRIKTYLIARPLWHDECSLALSIIKRDFWGYFQPLEHFQKAPLIFMMSTKLLTFMFGVNELTLRFIPFISGLFSIIIFYRLSEKFLVNKFSILAANFLFAVNYQLIYYSQEFKQYSLEVLLFMVGLLFFTSLDLDKISYKKCLFVSLIGLIMTIMSFPCLFPVFAYIAYCLINKVKFKKLLLFSLPIVLIFSVYYILCFAQMHGMEVADSYWQGGFLKLNISSFFIMMKENFNFFFKPNKFVLFQLILFFWGFALVVIRKKVKINSIILLSFVFILAASFFTIYPIWQRVALYLLPVVILLISKPVELINFNKKVKSAIILALFIFSFCRYNFNFINSFFGKTIFSREEQPAATIVYMTKHINNGDVIFVNNASDSEFSYYSSFYKLQNRVLIEKVSGGENINYYSVLESLPKGNYWFYLAYDYSRKPVVPIIISWAYANGDVIDIYKKDKSVLLNVEVK